MCVRIVSVLVLCCVQSWAQRDPTSGMDWDKAGVNVKPADLPSNLTVVALPLQHSDRKLQLNVSWVPSSGNYATGYSVEVKSVTETSDCESLVCYQPDIPKNATWVLLPPTWNTVHGSCSIRPGCAYLVTLTADPWDGITSVNLTKELGECEAGVCSCAHSPRLPVPVVSAKKFTFNNTLYSNVSWTLPTPSHPQRLPPKLRKQNYIVSLYKQLGTPTLIFSKLQFPVQVSGLVFEGDILQWHLLPIRLEQPLSAIVQLVDERGCVGPAGKATVFDSVPVEDAKPAWYLVTSKSKLSFGVYEILGVVIGAFAMGAVFVLVLKRVLKACRPDRVSAPLHPLIRRPVPFSNNFEYTK